jgi:preprotein translocase subunit SecA
LALIDETWKNHLRKMDELKQSVQLAVHEQKDPLLIYKFEAFELFSGMMGHLNKEVLSFLLKGSIPTNSNSGIQEAKRPSRREKLKTSKDDVLNTEELAAKSRSIGAGAGQKSRPTIETVVRDLPKIGRNDRVTIKNIQNGESKELKYKQAEPLISSGQWVLVGKN